MEKKKLFKNKTQMVIYITIFAICIFLFIYIGQMDFDDIDSDDALKISSLYSLVPDENLYTFCNATDVLQMVNKGSGVILFGFPSNNWTNYYASILNEVGIDLGLDRIYYYDFLKDRDESNGTYETIVNKLSVYVTVDDEGTKDIHAPTVLIVKNGEVIGYFDDTSYTKGVINPEDYYTESERNIKYEGFKTALIEYLK